MLILTSGKLQRNKVQSEDDFDEQFQILMQI